MKNKIFSALVMITGFIISFFIIWAYPQNAYATPPQDVKVTYDSKSDTLTVTITHKTLSQNYHYIKDVEIKKNGAVISKKQYANQPGPETFTYTYKLPAAKGDTMEVTATCNLWGHKTTTFVVADKLEKRKRQGQ